MIRKVFKQMLVAQIVSAMTVMICMLIDSLMIGRFLGVDSMTAYGLACPLLLVFASFGSMLSAGIQVICGKTMGCGDREATNACYSTAVVLSVLISGIGMVLVLVFTRPICRLLGAGLPAPANNIYPLTRDYLRGFIVGAPAFILAQISVPFLQISGNRSRLTVAVTVMTVSDIVFDVLNVFVFNGGTLGMGLASSLSYVLAVLITGAYFLKKDCMFKFSLRSVKPKLCGEILRAGVPTIINQFSLVLIVFALNNILLEVGQNAAVAAYSVISTVGNICYCFGSGIASVALLLSSVFYGDEDRTSLRQLVRTMCRFAIVLDLIVTVVVLLIAPYLVWLFLREDPGGATRMATFGLRLFILSLVPCSLNTSFKNYYQGVNRTGFTETISVLQNFALPALFAFLLSRTLRTTGVWLGFVCGESLTLLLIAAVVWIRQKKIVFSAEAFSMLPKDFGVPESDCLELSIKSMEEAAAASRKSAEFCAAHGETTKNSMLISLCVDEMVSNILQHGFPKDNREHNVELRILFKDTTRVIRIRDNCVNFDPLLYFELHKQDDPISHFGIRMVMKMVKRANYVNSLGLNNLTLVL